MAPMERQAVVAVLRSRDRLEHALQALQTAGIDQAQLSVLSEATPEQVARGDNVAGSGSEERPLDRGELGNLQGLMGGIPTYLGAVLAAGVTVASGGTLAGVAIAALAGGIGAGAVGVGAASLLRSGLDQTYEAGLRAGGLVLMVWPGDEAERLKAHRVLEECGAEEIRDQSVVPEPPAGRPA